MIPAHLARQVGSLAMGAIGLFLALALISYHPADIAFLSSSANHPVNNIGGMLGAWIGFLGREGFGWASLFLPAFALLWAIQIWRQQWASARGLTRTIGTLVFLAGAATLTALAFPSAQAQTQAGGILGYLAVHHGRYMLGAAGTALLAACVTALSWWLVADQQALPSRMRGALKRLVQRLSSRRREAPEPLLARSATPAAARTAAAPQERPRAATIAHEPAEAAMPAMGRLRSTVTPKPKAIPTMPSRARGAVNGFQLPSLDLLTTPPPLADRQLGEDPKTNARILEETLREFGIEASVVNIDRGPTVTRYELAPAPGVKLTKILSLSDDLALVLKAASCHITAPIPGKGLVGIDVPNSSAVTVYVKEIITSREFTQLASPLALGIGKDVSGHPIVADLRDCPHLLVAGATGSGKTVCLNSLLTGILYHASPDDVKFLMIDPKKVELVLFNDIPHLVAPVVTDAKRAAVALGWAVQEMERRYQVLAKTGVRNIDGFNQKIQAQGAQATESRMPYLIILIDELADLMMIAAQDVEGAITRLSQLSRAVGLHIILATQRPSVDVITGVIKANFPARIAFQVASKVDSRTILDMNGADKLLGRGDLLFLRPGTAKPIRAQSSFVTDAEIERLVEYLKAQRPPSYDEQLVTKQQQPADLGMMMEKDELYEMAKKLVLDTRQASTSLLQRRLRLGYARAARILDLMEQEGLVGPPQGSRPREILVEPQALSVGSKTEGT